MNKKITRRGFIGRAVSLAGALGVVSFLSPLKLGLPRQVLAPESVEASGAISAATKVLSQTARSEQAYPKLVVEVITTRSRAEIEAVFDTYYGPAQASIRALFASDPETIIDKWHYHNSSGTVEEIEPR